MEIALRGFQLGCRVRLVGNTHTHEAAKYKRLRVSRKQRKELGEDEARPPSLGVNLLKSVGAVSAAKQTRVLKNYDCVMGLGAEGEGQEGKGKGEGGKEEGREEGGKGGRKKVQPPPTFYPVEADDLESTMVVVEVG